jgi:undecaprenyl diphosphate synthase
MIFSLKEMIFEVNQTIYYMQIPVHVAIIPDGNRRWARNKNLPEFEGHRVSAEKTLPIIIDSLHESGVKYFTFWALSTENLKKRTQQELDNLINLMRFFLKRKINELDKKNIRIRIIGDVSVFPEDLQKLITHAMNKTNDNTDMTVIFAINYGGRDEIIRAVQKIVAENPSEELSIDDFKNYLDTADLPDPDLIIRTGGDKRISGFLLWQSEYAEYEFMDKLFPDFTEEDCKKSILNFSERERRFGK